MLLEKDSGWITDSSIKYFIIFILKYNPLAGSCYLKLPKEIGHPRKGLINIQNIDDNQCFRWSLVRYLNLTDHNPKRITKADKDFSEKLFFVVGLSPSKKNFFFFFFLFA